MDRFLKALPAGLREGRYRDDSLSLPSLRFGDGDFDLALCSHLLFLYSGTPTLGFHLAAIREMCRVAGEARVFPLLGAYGEPSPRPRAGDPTPARARLRRRKTEGPLRVPAGRERDADGYRPLTAARTVIKAEKARPLPGRPGEPSRRRWAPA